MRLGVVSMLPHPSEAVSNHLETGVSSMEIALLMRVEAEEWLARAGGISSFGIEWRHGCPKVSVNGRPMVLPKDDGSLQEFPTVDPVELCRSVSTNDECWIFTCGCGFPECAGIRSGIVVLHMGPYTIWISAERPDVPLGVFSKWRYRRSVLAAARSLLRASKGEIVECGVHDLKRKRLKQALGLAERGISWEPSDLLRLEPPE